MPGTKTILDPNASPSNRAERRRQKRRKERPAGPRSPGSDRPPRAPTIKKPFSGGSRHRG
mgnify:CR=1 FL=1